MNALRDTRDDSAPVRSSIDGFRDRYGFFSMVAVDQRDSLRSMLSTARGVGQLADEELVAFKRAVSETLTAEASGILLDHQFGANAADVASCRVILAADILETSQPGGPVDVASLDASVNASLVDSMNAGALKMLVPWLPDTREEAVDLTARFLELCNELGLPSVVEGVVRPRDVDDWSLERRADALVAAANDLASLGADLYKTELMYASAADRDVAVRTSRRLTDAVPCPWVLLSSGISASLFPDALSAACEGGAEGFLAGRAIWSSALGATNVEEHLRTTSRSILRTLADTTRRSSHA